jgi:lipoprotein-releasing system ATP-binding protein
MTFNLKATNLCKKYLHPQKVTILENISIAVKASESVAIMGASGEGKTTLLHILGLLEKPNNGQIEICSKIVDYNQASVIRNKSIGFIFQNFNLFEDFSVLDNVTFPARIARKDLKKSTIQAEKYLELTGLKDRINFSSKLLSGGEAQRVAIARAFCNDPLIILADEPSGNLDHENSKIIHELLLSITKNEQKSLLIATHDKKLASLCDRIYELKNNSLFEIK